MEKVIICMINNLPSVKIKCILQWCETPTNILNGKANYIYGLISRNKNK